MSGSSGDSSLYVAQDQLGLLYNGGAFGKVLLELDTLRFEDEPHRSWRHVVPSDGVGVTWLPDFRTRNPDLLIRRILYEVR